MRVAPRTSRGSVLVVERGPQLTDRVMEPGPRGPFGDAQDLRDLRERIPLVVMEDDDRSLFRSELAEGAFEFVPRRDGARNVGLEWNFGRDHADAGDPATLAARLGVAGVDHQAAQPGVESGGIAQCRKVAPGAEQGLLGGVLRAVLVAQDAVREGVAAVDAGRRRATRRRQCRRDSLARPVRPAWGPLRSAARVAASQSMEPAGRESFTAECRLMCTAPRRIVGV